MRSQLKLIQVQQIAFSFQIRLRLFPHCYLICLHFFLRRATGATHSPYYIREIKCEYNRSAYIIHLNQLKCILNKFPLIELSYRWDSIVACLDRTTKKTLAHIYEVHRFYSDFNIWLYVWSIYDAIHANNTIKANYFHMHDKYKVCTKRVIKI